MFVISNKDVFVKKCDTSLQYFIFKFDGIVFFIQIIETICKLLLSTSPYEKYIIIES